MQVEMGKKVVIIGAGLGGLFTGAILAKEGLEVTVVEKNQTVGGGLQSFVRFGEVFDTGMHVIAGMGNDGSIRKICRYLGIADSIRIKDVDRNCIDRLYFSEDKKYYDIACGREEYVDTLSRYFPHQRDNLKRYVDAMFRITDELDLFRLRRRTLQMKMHSEEFMLSASDFIAKYICDEKLRSVVAYMNPMYSGRYDSTPAFVHAIISVLYIKGPSRFEGGSHHFADALAKVITDNGGTIVTSDGVKTILTAGGMVSKIRTQKGLELEADYYISDIHPCALIKLLDDEKALPKAYRTRLESIPNSYSAFTLNIKLKPGTFRYFNHTAYYMIKYAEIWNFGNDDNGWPRGFLFMTPPNQNQGEFATKVIITAPMPWHYVSRWEDTTVGRRGAGYEAWKEECKEKLICQIEEIYPDFRNCIDKINTASPLTIRDYFGAKEGGMCGFSKDCRNIVLSQVPVVTKIKNLLLTGQNCNLHGFCGVPLTAITTSEVILGLNHVIDKINMMDFDDIRPYSEEEIPAAMQRIAQSESFGMLAGFVFPDRDVEEVRTEVAGYKTVRDFQLGVMYWANKQILKRSTTDFSFGGIENISKDKNYLYISNHRDIMLDASLLQNVLTDNGLDTCEITFGANLMQGQLVIDIGKSNKMFRVERPSANIKEFYKSSAHLSDYIRTVLTAKKQSVWIAQRNGRTKDGIDRTDQGIIKMFGMSGRGMNQADSLAELNIAPIAISYEWETCDYLKALELYLRQKGPYTKKPGEDLNSIITGIVQPKGRVHIEFCKSLTADELNAVASSCAPKEFNKRVAELIDSRICAAYHLSENNFIAHDMLNSADEYADKYDAVQKEAFVRHLEGLSQYVDGNDMDEMRRIFLGIYANPVDSKNLYRK